jgi:DNA-binding transcriptional ArsR family regulator
MQDQLDLIFTALANPTRRAMLDRLSLGVATVTDLGAPFALSQPTISSHIKILEAAGLVTRGRTANMRPVQLDAAALAQAHLWIGRYAQFWTDALERLETYATSLEQQETEDERDRPND